MQTEKHYLNAMNALIYRITEWVVDHRFITLMGCLVLGVGSILLSANLRIDNSIEAYFNWDDPSYIAYNTFMEEYGNDEFLYILYFTEKGISQMSALEKTKMLALDLEEIPYVEKVNAITNIEFIEGDETGDVLIYDLMEDFPENQSQADNLIKKLMDKPLYVSSYISKDKKYAAILCEMEDKPKNDPNYHMKIGSALKTILAKPDYKEFTFIPVGNPVLNSEFYFIFEKETRTRPLLTYALLIIFLALFFKQIKGVLGPLLVVIFSVLLVIGFIGFIDFPITAMFGATPSLLIAIGVATSVHIINEYRSQLFKGKSNKTAILSAVKLVGLPCTFTALTTTVGFASLLLSPVSATRDFGYYTVFGVLANLLFCFTVLFVVLSIGGDRTEKVFFRKSASSETKIRPLDKMLKKIADLNKDHFNIILIAGLIISILSLWGITRLEINSSFLEEYGPRVQTYHDHKFVDRVMGGSENFEILLNSNISDGVKTLQFVKTLEKIQAFAESQNYLVSKTVSIVDIVKEINRALHNNNKEYYRLPSSDEAVSQYILLYEASGGEELEKLVSGDIATARLTIYSKSSDSKTSKKFYDDLTAYIDSVIPEAYDYKITGISFLIVKAMKYIEDTQISSISMALLVISLLMVVVFGSVKVGALSILPNLFPIILTLGLMGWAGIWLDYVRTLIACIAIGLAVDDTIHFMARFRIEFYRFGKYEPALYATMAEVGRAITITTCVLIIGFSVSMTSQLNDGIYFGLLSSICIFIALLADYFICPSLILRFKPFGKEFEPSEK